MGYWPRSPDFLEFPDAYRRRHPAFNEAGNIGRLDRGDIRGRAAGELAEVIVVDDASDDGTDAEIKAMLAAISALRYLRHGRRAGQSAALRTA